MPIHLMPSAAEKSTYFNVPARSAVIFVYVLVVISLGSLAGPHPCDRSFGAVTFFVILPSIARRPPRWDNKKYLRTRRRRAAVAIGLEPSRAGLVAGLVIETRRRGLKVFRLALCNFGNARDRLVGCGAWMSGQAARQMRLQLAGRDLDL